MTRSRIINWWIRRKLDDLHIVLAVCGMTVSLAGVFGGYPQIERVGNGSLIILAAVHLLHLHLHRFQAYLDSHEQFDRLPVRQMGQVSAFLMTGFFAAFFLCIFLGAYLPWRAFGKLLGHGLLLFFRWLARFFSSSDQMPVEESMGKEGGLMPELPVEETSLAALFLEKVFYLLFLALAAALLFWLAAQGIKRLVRFLGSFHFDEDEKSFLEPRSFKEKTAGEGRPAFFERYRPHFDRTHAGRIRRMYWRCVQQKRKEQKTPALAKKLSVMTPAQIEAELGLWQQESGVCTAHGLYEKARYGYGGCSQEEEKEMRELLRASKKQGLP